MNLVAADVSPLTLLPAKIRADSHPLLRGDQSTGAFRMGHKISGVSAGLGGYNRGARSVQGTPQEIRGSGGCIWSMGGWIPNMGGFGISQYCVLGI